MNETFLMVALILPRIRIFIYKNLGDNLKISLHHSHHELSILSINRVLQGN